MAKKLNAFLANGFPREITVGAEKITTYFTRSGQKSESILKGLVGWVENFSTHCHIL